jgi:aryl-alcohol dehydrogenase-like predicted oxidoreductase
MGGLHVPSQRNLDIASKVMEIGERLGRTPSQVALRWVLQRGTMPILGARKLEHIRDNLACLDFEIPEAEMQELNQASHIDMGFPHDFLSRDLPKGFVFGKTRDRIHPHR